MNLTELKITQQIFKLLKKKGIIEEEPTTEWILKNYLEE